MKFVVAVVVLIVVVLVGVRVTLAATGDRTIYRQRGVWCQAGAVGVRCLPDNDLGGYGVAINRNAIVVLRFGEKGPGKVVFARTQP